MVLFRNENRSGRQHWPSQSCEVRSCLKFNFAGMPAVKLCDGSRCQRRTFSFVREVAQVVPAVTSQIHQQHIRARLYWGKKLIVRFADDFVRSSFHCIFKKLGSKVFIQKKLLMPNSEWSKRNFQSHSFSTFVQTITYFSLMNI